MKKGKTSRKALPDSGGSITIKLRCVFPSLNRWYAGSHWSARHKTKQELQGMILAALMRTPGVKFTTFRVHYRYNNKFDCDNTITAIKIFVDTMKTAGIILDDSPKYFKGLCIEYDKGLEYNEHYFEVVGE